MNVKQLILLVAAFLISNSVSAQEVSVPVNPASKKIVSTSIVQEDSRGTLIFEDDFERNESQENKDEIGKGWGSNSAKRAAGNKQVDLKDGAMYISRHKAADHGVSVTHPAEFTNGSVEIKFMLENEKDSLGLNFADLKYKKVHAGHLFKVTIGVNYVQLDDLKTGKMNLETRKQRLAKTITAEQTEALKSKTKKFPNKLETKKWYTAVANVDGETLSVSIDGKEVGSFTSAGIAHPTKRTLRLAIAKQVVVDDLKIYARTGGTTGAASVASTAGASGEAPLKVLLVAGGCCHDYATQTKLLKEGIEKRIKSEVTVVYNPDTKTTATFEIYNKDDWADGYDVILHDECTASVTDEPYVKRILAAHKKGIPAVNIHCAMHSYRWGDFHKPVQVGAVNSGWYEMIGVQSSAHGPKAPIEVTKVQTRKDGVLTDHPIIAGMETWTTVKEELYNNVRMFSSVEILAMGKQIQKPNARQLKKNPNMANKTARAAVVWTNVYGPNKTKIFNTSLGHFNETVADDRYMELVVRGLLWTTGNLTKEGKPTKAFAVGK